VTYTDPPWPPSACRRPRRANSTATA
jgi:hypothetical protein